MGSNIPETLPDFITWCNTHAPLFTANAALIGLTAPQAELFAQAAANMVAAEDAAQNARVASKNATAALDTAVAAARALAGGYVSTIKGFAKATGNPSVYELSGVSPDSPPGTVPAPVAPTDFTAQVNPDGSLTIRWKVSQPAGVTSVQYLVFRRLPMNGQTTFTMVGSEGKNKSFTDATLPVGVDKVDYIVQPKRGEVTGPQSNVFTVQFGSVAGGGSGTLSIKTTASTPHAEPMKLAA